MKKAVLISCFNWYEARLKPIRRLLVEQGYEVSILIADFDHIKKKVVSPQFDECTYIHVPEYKTNISFARIKSHFCFGKQCKKFIWEQKPELIYCQVPPNKVVDYCADYKKKNQGIKFIIDIIDLWPESMPLGGLRNTPPAKVWKRWRDSAIQVADHVFTECTFYQEKLKRIIIPSKTTTLHLYKEQREEEKQLVSEIIQLGKKDDIVRFAYLGSMNNIIDIDQICDVIQTFIHSGKTCELYAIGDGESREKFEEAVKSTGCKTMFYGCVFDELEKIRILTPCDYAFNMMKSDISVGLTIKSIDYLSYGLPLINNITGDTWKLVEEEKIGMNVSDNSISLASFDHSIVLGVFHNYFSKERFIERVGEAL